MKFLCSPDPLAIEASQPTPKTVHSVLLLYAQDDAALDIQVRSVTALLEAQGVHICHQRRLSLREDGQGIAREHFGFADGISQPVPTGEAILPPSGPGSAELLRWHGAKAGEILLGHENWFLRLDEGSSTRLQWHSAPPCGGRAKPDLLLSRVSLALAYTFRVRPEKNDRVPRSGVTAVGLAG